ncbi:hypothetical protein U1Q18_040964 [Sarracenia purpurea var. burkii]
MVREEVERLESEKKMPSTLLEVTRAGHEEVKRLERLIVKDLQTVPATSKDRLHQGHRVRNMIDKIITTTLKLVDIYEDKDNARKNEIAALGGQTVTGTNVDIAFYDRLKDNARKDENEIAALGGQTVSETNVLNAFYDRLKDNARKDEDEIAALGGQTVTETNVLNAFYDEIAALGGQTVTETNVLNAFYDRLKDNAWKDEDEIAALGGQTVTKTNVFNAFYDRLKEVFLPTYLDF